MPGSTGVPCSLSFTNRVSEVWCREAKGGEEKRSECALKVAAMMHRCCQGESAEFIPCLKRVAEGIAAA